VNAWVQLYGGHFSTRAEAALSYDLMAVYLHGEGANTNFPLSMYSEEIKRRDEVWRCLLVVDSFQRIKGNPILVPEFHKYTCSLSAYIRISLVQAKLQYCMSTSTRRIDLLVAHGLPHHILH
jgi:hypothetical protein